MGFKLAQSTVAGGKTCLVLVMAAQSAAITGLDFKVLRKTLFLLSYAYNSKAYRNLI